VVDGEGTGVVDGGGTGVFVGTGVFEGDGIGDGGGVAVGGGAAAFVRTTNAPNSGPDVVGEPNATEAPAELLIGIVTAPPEYTPELTGDPKKF
jgi:hypothetical protein